MPAWIWYEKCISLGMRSLFFLLALSFSTLLWAKPIDVRSQEPHFVQSLETGTKALAKRLQLIEKAQHTINVEYFIFDTSDASRIFIETLLQKKRQNPEIQIRIIVDYFSLSKSLDSFYSRALLDAGIDVRHYNDTFLLNLSSVTSRNHRKLLTIDGQEAIVGGRNMANEYFDMAAKFNFSDRDVWLKGDIVTQIDESFEHFWNYRRTKRPGLPAKPRNNGNTAQFEMAVRRYNRRVVEAKKFASLFDAKLDQELIELRQRVLEMGARELSDEPIYEVKNIRFISDGPDFKNKEHRISGIRYYELMAEAKKEISIEVPYFYMQGEEQRFFEELKTTGLEINLLINSKKASKEFAINYITLLQGLEFSRMGYNLFLNRGNFMNPENLPSKKVRPNAFWGVHAKTLIIDKKITWIGSLNMDPRSVQRLNAEMGVVIEDEAFGQRVNHHYQQRLEDTYIVKNGKIQNQSRYGDDPAQLSGLMERLASLKTIPLYIFENQI